MGWDPFGSKAAKKIKKAAAQQAAALRAQAAAEAKALRFNANIYEENADAVEAQAYVDEAKYRRRSTVFMGEQDAALAGSGFKDDIGFDDIRENTEEALDFDALIIRRQGQATADDNRSQAELLLMNADSTIAAGEAAAKGAILNGAVQAQIARNNATSSTIGLALDAGKLAIAVSDMRVKENIEQIGVLPTGDGLYAFNYVWEPAEMRRMGVMAQEVRRRVPEAVTKGEDGVLYVDYGKLGLPLGYSLATAIRKRR